MEGSRRDAHTLNYRRLSRAGEYSRALSRRPCIAAIMPVVEPANVP